MAITKRERSFITGGICLLTGLIIFQFLLYPAFQRARDLNRLILQKEKELREMRVLKKEFASLKQARVDLSSRLGPEERALSPLARLESWIERAELKRNIKAIKPLPGVESSKEEMVIEVSLEKTDLPHLTRFLYLLESSLGGFNISRLSIKPRYTTPRFLDVNMQIVFYRS